MATERGECVVWHFPSRERVKVLLNCGKKFQKLKEEEERRKNGEPEPAEDDNKSNSSEGSYNDYYSAANQYVRIAKFNPVPLFNYSKSTTVRLRRVVILTILSLSSCVRRVTFICPHS
jgi:hypothetical protein